MVAGVLMLALLGTSSGARGQVDSPRWDRLRCFAYSPAADAYACFEFDLHSDHWIDVRPMDFERFVPPRGVAWGGHKAVRLVGPGLDKALAISEHPYERGRAILRTRSARAAMRKAEANGFTAPVSREVPLPSDRWVEIRGARLRFETRYHVGDASEYAIGSLELDCGGAEKGSARLVELLKPRRGRSAVAFVASAAPGFAVGVLTDGGGEESGYFSAEYLHVDPRRVCAGR